MDRRRYLALVGSGVTLSIAGCAGDDDSNERYEQSAESYLLSADEISNILPGQRYSAGGTRPGMEFAGLETSQVTTFDAVFEDNQIELGVFVFESTEDAQTAYDDTIDASSADSNSENIGDEAVSASALRESSIFVRVSNILIATLSEDFATEFLRRIAQNQVDAITE